MAMSQLQALLDSFEARLSTVEQAVGSGSNSRGIAPAGGASSAGSDSSNGDDLPASVTAFDEYCAKCLEPFVVACKTLGGGAAAGGAVVKKAWAAQRDFIVMAAACKKPEMAVLASKMGPLQTCMKEAGDCRTRDEFENHTKAIGEAMGCVSWVAMYPPAGLPKDMVEPTIGGSDYWANKVRMQYRKTNPEQVKFCDTLKALLTDLLAYVQAHHKTGLEWNPKGGDVASYTAGSTSDAAKAKPDAPAGGISALFGDISKGLGVTSGLKKRPREEQEDTPHKEGMEGAASGAKAAAAVLSVPAAVPIDKGQLFPTRGAARTAAETELAATGRAIKNGSSSGRVTFHVVCKTCTSWFVKAQRQGNGDFKVTQVGKDHVNCVGGGRRPSANVVQPMIDQLVRANPKIGCPAIKRTLKTAGFDISDRTSQRSKRRIATASRAEEADAIAQIPSWCEEVERDCPGSVVTVEVTRDQQTWRSEYKGDAAAPVSAPKAAPSKPMAAAAKPGPKGPPKVEFMQQGMKWIVENHGSSEEVVTVEVTDKKHQVYIYGCMGATIDVKGKCKMVAIDGCKKTQVLIDDAISSVELVNCQRVKVQVRGSVPSVAVDKTDGFLCYLSKDGLETTFVTSKSSEMNVAFPKPGTEDEQMEMPIPEQFQHTLQLEPVPRITSDVSDLYSH